MRYYLLDICLMDWVFHTEFLAFKYHLDDNIIDF